MDYQDHFIYLEGKILLQNETGGCIAEIVFPAISDQAVNLTRTFVDPVLRGEGVAGQLTLAAYRQNKAAGKKILPTCSYAVSWFAEHPEYADILLNPASS
jgi:predicted GNAT family acetyltransferase